MLKVVSWLTVVYIYSIGIDESIRRDVADIKKAPFLRKDMLVLGYALDLDTGLVREVVWRSV